MNNAVEAAPIGTATPPTLAEKLAALVEWDQTYKFHKAEMNRAKEVLDELKAACLIEFEQMGVDQMKTGGRTIYIAHQYWAGAAQDVSNALVAEELQRLGMQEHVSFNHQSLSAYVRELAREHPELVNARNEIIATPEEIVAVLPGKLSELCRVSDKIDLKVRKA